MKSLLFVSFLLFLLPVLDAQQCRSYQTCSLCLQDPACGWCETYGDCAEGSSSGPTLGSCSDWEFESCPPSPPPSPPLAPPNFTLGEDWPMFGASPSHDAYRPVDYQVTQSRIIWTARFQNTRSSNSVLCYGMLLATTYDAGKTYLSALDALTGTSLFQVPLGSGTQVSAPSCRDGIAYVETFGAFQDTYFYAVDLSKQSVKWSSHISNGGSPSNGYGMVSHPSNGLVYGNEGTGTHLYAFNEADGTQNFSSYLVAQGCGSWTPTISKHSDDQIYWVTQCSSQSDFGVFGVNEALSPAFDWQLPLPSSYSRGGTDSVVVVSNDIALVSLVNSVAPGGLSAISLTKQDTIWQAPSCDHLSSSYGTFDDHSLSSDGKVVAYTCDSSILLYDLETGELQSNLTCPSCTGQPIITPNFLISASDRTVYLVPRSGEPLVELYATGMPLLSGNAVFVTDLTTARVVAFQLLS